MNWALRIVRYLTLAGVVVRFLNAQLAQAQEKAERDSLTNEVFTCAVETNRYELSLNQGVLISPFIADGGRPDINYTISELQFGRMLSSIRGKGLFRGNWELAGEAFGGAVYTGIGSYVVGATLWLRYNFIQPEARLVPFAQAGAGIAFTDIDRTVIGEEFNFNLNLGVGVRYLIGEHWSVNLEYRYQHISDAHLSSTNVGINAEGPIVGISYFF